MNAELFARALLGVVIVSALASGVGCSGSASTQGQTSTAENTQQSAASANTSVGADLELDDPTVEHTDTNGDLPADIFERHVAAVNAGDYATDYELYTDAEIDEKSYLIEAKEADERYWSWKVLETRVVNEASAFVRVAYESETTPPSGNPYSIDVAEPGEWWALTRVDGQWRLRWMPRQ
jgi:hypothetical protein